MSKYQVGCIPWNKGIKTGIVPKTAFKKGNTPWTKGLTKDISEKIREASEKMIKTKRTLFKEGKLGTREWKIDKEVLSSFIREGLTSKEIAKRYCVDEKTVGKKIRKFGMRNKRMWKKRLPFSTNENEKAYMYGLILGDFTVRKQRNKIAISGGSTRYEQINMFIETFGKYYDIGIYTASPPEYGWVMQAILDNSFNFLLNDVTSILNWIGDNQERWLNFFGGFIDCEGCFTIIKKKTPKFHLGNTNYKIIFFIREKLEKFKPTKIYTRKNDGRKDFYTFTIGRKERLLAFIDLISPFLKHEKRIENALLIKKMFRGD